MRDDEISTRARALGAAVEPIAGQVYFSPECHARYEALGFGASPQVTGGVALPDGPAYFCSRGSVMGQVSGEVIAAAFGVFNPAAVVPAVAHGWTLTDGPTICAARTAGATEQLVRILGDQPDGVERATELLAQANGRLRPEGRPLFAGLLSLGLPGDPVGDLWRLADRLREYRGDAHTAAWTSAGFDGTEIGLLTELYWGLPARSYVRTRAWSGDDLDAAEARLVDRGLLAGGALTEAGHTAREDVERATDRQCRPVVEALGDGFDELVGLLRPWGAAVRAAGGYLASGPHDLAQARRSGT
ncbi:hypothetical protein BH24ACT3_BH24ACT3_04740 [soil metagenome]